MGRGAWWAIVHRVTKSRTRLSDYTLHLATLGLRQQQQAFIQGCWGKGTRSFTRRAESLPCSATGLTCRMNMVQPFVMKKRSRASLLFQWLRICLTVQGTPVRPLLWEDPTCHRTNKPVCHNYQACTLEPTSSSYWSPCTIKPVIWNKRSPHTSNRE